MKTEIVVILDRSGSMHSILDDAIGGFNGFLAEQQRVPGEAVFSLVLFDDRYEVPWDQIPLARARELTRRTYGPRGNTALYDAIGKTVSALEERTAPGDNVILAILTDGQENASRQFSASQIRNMLERHQREGWTVIYLGANQDAFAVGSSMGIRGDTTYNFAADGKGVATAYAQMSRSTLRARQGI